MSSYRPLHRMQTAASASSSLSSSIAMKKHSIFILLLLSAVCTLGANSDQQSLSDINIDLKSRVVLPADYGLEIIAEAYRAEQKGVNLGLP